MSFLIYGPAYLDITVNIDRRLVGGDAPVTVDQSLASLSVKPRRDGLVVLRNKSGDDLTFHLPAGCSELAATYQLTEPLLARILGQDTKRRVVDEYPVSSLSKEVGGMGAGYAMAFNGILRFPVGSQNNEPDETGRAVLNRLEELGVKAEPEFISGCKSDHTLLVLSKYGDKLAVGLREALPLMTLSDRDRGLIGKADAVVFCGVSNELMSKIPGDAPDIPVMCAPGMRNVTDSDFPLSDFADSIDYLTLNSLEWEHLADQHLLKDRIPVITVTEGPKGSRIFVKNEEYYISALPHSGQINTNRAGETYGSTFFKVLLNADPVFHQKRSVSPELAIKAGRIAAAQANRQLDITGFGFPSDDWLSSQPAGF